MTPLDMKYVFIRSTLLAFVPTKGEIFFVLISSKPCNRSNQSCLQKSACKDIYNAMASKDTYIFSLPIRK